MLQPKATSLCETLSSSQARQTCALEGRRCSCEHWPWTHTREWARRLEGRLAHDSNHKAAASYTQDYLVYSNANILCRLDPSITAQKYLYLHSLWIEPHHFSRFPQKGYTLQESCRICDMSIRAKLSSLHGGSRAQWRCILSKRAFKKIIHDLMPRTCCLK